MHQYSQDEHEEIAAMLESGEYFEDGLAWYDVKYHQPIAERCFFIIVTGLAALIIFFTLRAALSLFPLVPVEPIVTLVPDLEDKVAAIRPLGNSQTDADDALQAYLVEEYVARRERYDSQAIEAAARYIRQWSTAEEYQRYHAWMDPRNPDSPIVRYERHTFREIAMRNVNIGKKIGVTADGSYIYEADAVFDAVTRDRKGRQRAAWQVTLRYVYEPLTADQLTGAVEGGGFVVSEYRVARYVSPQGKSGKP